MRIELEKLLNKYEAVSEDFYDKALNHALNKHEKEHKYYEGLCDGVNLIRSELKTILRKNKNN